MDALLLALCGTIAVVNSVSVPGIPNGYILDVDMICTDGLSDAALKIASDLRVHYNVICAFDNVTGVLEDDTVSVDIPLKHNGGSSDGNCYFNTITNTGIYQVTLRISWSQQQENSFTQNALFTVTCAVSENKDVNSTVENVIHEGLRGEYAPQVILHNNGGTLADNISVTVEMQDILGNTITQASHNKKVKLVATGYEILPVNCNLYYGSESYNILRSGCGDGRVIPKNKGFFTYANVSSSPYFNVLKHINSAQVQFSCTFLKCEGYCDGSSCIPENTKKFLKMIRKKHKQDLRARRKEEKRKRREEKKRRREEKKRLRDEKKAANGK